MRDKATRAGAWRPSDVGTEDPESWLRAQGCDPATISRMTRHYGAGFAELLAKEVEDGDDVVRVPGGRSEDGQRMRERTTTVTPFNRLYMRMVRGLGVPEGKVQVMTPKPVPARAWLEVQRAMAVPGPHTFSTKEIAEAVEAMGGMTEIQRVSNNTSRRQFTMIYKELVTGW